MLQEHRFAFYFWAKWAREHRLGSKALHSAHVPDLVTLDWHQDLCAPSSVEKSDIGALNLADLEEVALFAWSRLNPLNDGHILAAAYAGLIRDIYVLCKHEDPWLEEFTDLAGVGHRTRVFHSLGELVTVLPRDQPLYFDVDLDYFTESEDGMGGGENVRLVPDDEVRAVLDPRGPLLRLVLPQLAGFTLAMEPTWCGGARPSHHLFGLLDETLFDPPLLHVDAGWREGLS
jgi:hypothetical protein